MDKNSIEVTFDFDDCYRECMDSLDRLGYGFGCDETDKLDVRLKRTGPLAERNFAPKDTERMPDSVCEPDGTERRAV